MSHIEIPPSRWKPATAPDAGHGAGPQPQSPQPRRWRALLALGLVWCSAVTGVYTPWALVLLWWAAVDLSGGSTWFMETVERRTHPVVFSLIIGSWLVLGIVMIGMDVLAWRAI